MQQDKDIRDELKDLAPHLANIERVEAFEVPAAYFEEFPARVREAIAMKEAKPESGWLGQWIPRYSYVAASLCFLLILGGFLLLRNTASYDKMAAARELKTVPSTEYVIEQMDEDLIVEHLPAAEEPKASENTNIKKERSGVSEQYILENIEESTITEEL